MGARVGYRFYGCGGGFVWTFSDGGGTLEREYSLNANGAFGIAVDGNQKAIVSCYDSSAIIYHTWHEASMATVSVGNNPRGICVDRNNAVWVACEGAPVVQRVENMSVAQTISFPQDSSPYGICVDRNDRVFVTCNGSSSVRVIQNNTITSNIAVGGQPTGICVDKNNAVWVACQGDQKLYKIVGGAVSTSVTVGNQPQGVCIDDNNAVWVACQGSQHVYKIVNDAVETYYGVSSQPFGICYNGLRVNVACYLAQKTVNATTNESVGDSMYNVRSFGDGSGFAWDTLFNTSKAYPQITVKRR